MKLPKLPPNLLGRVLITYYIYSNPSHRQTRGDVDKRVLLLTNKSQLDIRICSVQIYNAYHVNKKSIYYETTTCFAYAVGRCILIKKDV